MDDYFDNKMSTISIHAPREGGDIREHAGRHLDDISIHAPREGGDQLLHGRGALLARFQSTPPARGATKLIRVAASWLLISIHAPREGGDRIPKDELFAAWAFQSTPPARGATMSSGRIPHCTRYFNPRPPRGGRLRR